MCNYRVPLRHQNPWHRGALSRPPGRRAPNPWSTALPRRQKRDAIGSPAHRAHANRSLPSFAPPVPGRYTVYALDLPGMGYSQIMPGASYDEPTMRVAAKSLITQLHVYQLRSRSVIAVTWRTRHTDILYAALAPERLQSVRQMAASTGAHPKPRQTVARRVGPLLWLRDSQWPVRQRSLDRCRLQA